MEYNKSTQKTKNKNNTKEKLEINTHKFFDYNQRKQAKGAKGCLQK
jgi:hypothetical protein